MVVFRQQGTGRKEPPIYGGSCGEALEKRLLSQIDHLRGSVAGGFCRKAREVRSCTNEQVFNAEAWLVEPETCLDTVSPCSADQ